MRAGHLALLIVGCATAVSAASRSADDRTLLKMGAEKTADEAPLMRPIVRLSDLIDQTPDGGQIIGLYKSARTVGEVEAANKNVKAEVIKAQSIASDVSRLHAATIKSCEEADASQVEAIGIKARALSSTLLQVDRELTKSLTAMRQDVENKRSASIMAREEVNRFLLATHELGRLRVQVQEVAKAIEGVALGIRSTAAACRSTSIPPLFAEDSTSLNRPTGVRAAPGRPIPLPPRRAAKPTTFSATPRW